jgi:hypothetical protein
MPEDFPSFALLCNVVGSFKSTTTIHEVLEKFPSPVPTLYIRPSSGILIPVLCRLISVSTNLSKILFKHVSPEGYGFA